MKNIPANGFWYAIKKKGETAWLVATCGNMIADLTEQERSESVILGPCRSSKEVLAEVDKWKKRDRIFKALPNVGPTKGDIRIVQDYMPEASKKIALIFEYDGENWLLVSKEWSVVKAVEELYERLANEDLECCQGRDSWEGGDDTIARAKRLVGELNNEIGGMP